jgi:hypothetical protein
MATSIDDDSMPEMCEHCERETLHEVSIELRTESRKEQNAEFSREPYRVATCRVCGTANVLRMNNA